MSSGQKLFLMLVTGYFLTKMSLGVLMWAVSKRLQSKGLEVQRNKKTSGNKTL